MKRILLAPLLLAFVSPANAFWGGKKSIKLCYQWKSGEISTTEIIKKLGLYMPRSIQNGRALFEWEVKDYCDRTLKE